MVSPAHTPITGYYVALIITRAREARVIVRGATPPSILQGKGLGGLRAKGFHPPPLVFPPWGVKIKR